MKEQMNEANFCLFCFGRKEIRKEKGKEGRKEGMKERRKGGRKE